MNHDEADSNRRIECPLSTSILPSHKYRTQVPATSGLICEVKGNTVFDITVTKPVK
ncbi:MAG: hypothetical protein LBE12_02970 [Planctomycetaceae bacterium]|nr:hypothetical protein [Planctomycetaceae bacterium]